jgi:hypothetical protein
MGPDQFFMRIPPELFREAFGSETFQLAQADAAPAGDETDLFQGL